MSFFGLKAPKDELGNYIRSLVREYAETLTLAIVVAIVIRFYIVSAYYIPTETMAPNLRSGDYILGWRLPFGVNVPFTGYKFGGRPPQRGQILIFNCPKLRSQLCIKRAVAVGGDRVEMRGGRLILNDQICHYQKVSSSLDGVILKETCSPDKEALIEISDSPEMSDFGPEVIPSGHVFVLSDKRDEGGDSRLWGPVPWSDIEASALIIWLSIDWERPKVEGSALGVRLDRLFSRPD